MVLVNNDKENLNMKINEFVNDFIAGQIKKGNFTLEEKQLIIAAYFEKIKSVENRFGRTPNIRLLKVEDDNVVLTDAGQSVFNMCIEDIFNFMQNAASKNKNSLVVNAFRLKTADQFKSVVDY